MFWPIAKSRGETAVRGGRRRDTGDGPFGLGRREGGSVGTEEEKLLENLI